MDKQSDFNQSSKKDKESKVSQIKYAPNAFSRASFLQGAAGVAGAALALSAPDFLAARTKLTSSDNILIVLQLAGGNDGLNTLVPYTNDHYFRARPRLGLKKQSCLQINAELGLHPALSGFKKLYDNGQLAIVQGVGYPEPNRSHFRSQDIWQTASDAKQVLNTGWLGRWFEAHSDQPADIALALGARPPREFASRYPKGITLQANRLKRLQKKTRGAPVMAGDFDEDSLSLADFLEEREGGSIGAPSGSISGVSALQFLETAFADTDAAQQRVQAALQKAPQQSSAGYPAGRLALDLQSVARLIHGGMQTRVYHLHTGGFDTHANQKGAHERLLKNLGDCLAAFMSDLRQRSLHTKVTVMVWSEFGRRVRENGGGGTDHGVAGPVFVIGDVSGGLYGRYPDLAPDKLHKGDLVHTVDFRSVYATLAQRILSEKPERLLGRNFPILNFL